MACQAIHSWTFGGLVAAFIDLAITYWLLCCSTIAFFLSKILNFFGLTLPCSCDGRFGNPKSNPNSNRNPCLQQRLLVDCPSEKLSALQLSIKSKFPFDSIWEISNEGAQVSPKLVRDIDLDNRGAEVVCNQASISSLSDDAKQQLKRPEGVSATGSDSVSRNEISPSIREGKFDVKGKGIVSQRPRSSLRRRRRSSVSRAIFASISSSDRLRSDRVVPWSASSVDKIGDDLSADNSADLDSNDGQDTSVALQLRHSRALGASKSTDKNSLSSEGHRSITGSTGGDEWQEENTIRMLQQALEEEQAAHAKLCCELEKERIAAATAADEAMAMILRLQEEKASIELEARQYERILEEKSAYDAEEMDILKEIIIRREQEKHFLEKEVERYSNILAEDEQFEGNKHSNIDEQSHNASSLPQSSEDPMRMLQQFSEYIDKGGKENCRGGNPDDASVSIEIQNHGRELSFLGTDERTALTTQEGDPEHLNVGHQQLRASQEFQEKIMVSKDGSPFAQQKEVNRAVASVMQQGQSDDAHVLQAMGHRAVKMNDDAFMMQIDKDEEYSELQARDNNPQYQSPCSSLLEAEIYDVHVVDDECKIYGKGSVSGGELLHVHDDAPFIEGKCQTASRASDMEGAATFNSCSTSSDSYVEAEMKSNSSSMHKLLPPLSSRSKPSRSEMRRKSVDCERLKIENEVGWLRERLRTVQKGREKLNVSVEYLEREKSQFQLLEVIADQLREIRQLTEPRTAMRQASLPSPSSKVTSKKKRCRSASIGPYLSS